MDKSLLNDVEELINLVGSGNCISTQKYINLMSNLDKIDYSVRKKYQEKCVDFIKSKIQKEIELPNYYSNINPYFGEYMQAYMGIPRNSIKDGELLGLELKTQKPEGFVTLCTYSPVNKISKVTGINTQDLICSNKRLKEKCYSPQKCTNPKHVFYYSEVLQNGKENKLGKLKFDLKNEVEIEYKVKINEDWTVVDKIHINDLFSKFKYGYVLVIIDKNSKKKEKKFKIEQAYFVPDVMNQLPTLIRNEEIIYEIRNSPKIKNGSWDGYTYLNKGWGLRINFNWIKENWMIEDYSLSDIK